MKRFIGILLAVCMIITMLPTAFADGSALIISNLDDLKAFRDRVNSGETFDNQFVKLTTNIDLDGETWTPIGNGTNKFLGTFDGGNFTISNLYVDIDANNAGLFGFASVIQNVKLVNAKVSGVVCVGALVGELESSVGTVDNCHVSGRIEITGENSVGGLAGKGYANIKNSSVTGDGVNTSFVLGVAGTTEEGDNIGGLMGHLGEGNTLGVADSTVKNIKVSGTRKIGGLVGTTARANDYVGNTVDGVTVECTATAAYADANASTTTIGGIIGNYFGSATSGGILEDSTVSNVTFIVGNAKSAGALVGGDRVNNGGAPVGVEASGSKVTNVTGATSSYFAVAEVNGITYPTLQAAIDAANGNTVTILTDIELANGVTIPENKAVTIELNGKTISRNTEAATSTAAITNNGNLTIQDSIGGGKITAFAANPDTAPIPYYASNTITNCGTLTIKSGTIENSTGNEARAAFPIDNNSTSRDAIVNIEGGLVTGRGAIRQFANSITHKNEVNVTGGKITGTSYGIWTQNPNSNDNTAALNISDGEVAKVLIDPSAHFDPSITGGTIAEVAIRNADTENEDRNPSNFVKGGNFSKPVDEKFLDESLTTELYDTVKNPDAPYSYYKSVEDAKAAAVGGDAVITAEDGTTIEAIAVVLDANGGECEKNEIGLFADEKIGELPTPTREGYTFLGWFTAKEEGTEVTADTVFSADATIYAQWEKVEEEKKVEVDILPPKAESKPLGSGVLTAISAASNRMTITAAAGEGGRITSEGAKSVIFGSKLTYAIFADAGYEIENVVIDGEDMGAISSYTFKNIRENHTISVTFKKAA